MVSAVHSTPPPPDCTDSSEHYLGADDSIFSEFNVVSESAVIPVSTEALLAFREALLRLLLLTRVLTHGRTDRRTASLDISCRCLIVIPEPSFTFELRTRAHAQQHVIEILCSARYGSQQGVWKMRQRGGVWRAQNASDRASPTNLYCSLSTAYYMLPMIPISPYMHSGLKCYEFSLPFHI
jgi:hypothetical protein